MANYTSLEQSELLNHEQTIFWTFIHILDKLCIEGEAREIAINEFKDKLINKNLLE